MRLRCASTPRFLNLAPDLTTVQNTVRALAVNFFLFYSPSFSLLFVFLLIPNLIFYSTVRGLTKFKTRRSLSD